MQDSLANRILIGGLLCLAGLVIIIFHDRIRRFNDKINGALLGSRWIGEYSRGGLLFLRVVSIIFGAVFLIYGLLVILHIFD